MGGVRTCSRSSAPNEILPRAAGFDPVPSLALIRPAGVFFPRLRKTGVFPASSSSFAAAFGVPGVACCSACAVSAAAAPSASSCASVRLLADLGLSDGRFLRFAMNAGAAPSFSCTLKPSSGCMLSALGAAGVELSGGDFRTLSRGNSSFKSTCD